MLSFNSIIAESADCAKNWWNCWADPAQRGQTLALTSEGREVTVFPAPNVLARVWTNLTSFGLNIVFSFPSKLEKTYSVHGAYHKKLSETQETYTHMAAKMETCAHVSL